jgi:NUMOD4 motif-containing protein/HNH endonuclease
MENEIWKGVLGWENRYEVSSIGRVRSVEREGKHYSGSKSLWKSKMLKFNINRGYKHVLLYRSEFDKQRTGVHRLVAAAFIPNPDNKPTVNHINCNPGDNRVENLEWATYKEQQDHAAKSGHRYMTLGEMSNFSKLTESDVIEIRRLFDNGIMTRIEIANKFSMAKSNVQYIVNRQTWKHI